MAFKNLDDLFRHVKKEVQESMKSDVSEVVKDVQQYAIEKEVYDKYDPFNYSRRKENGGLQDKDNMIEVVDVVGNQIILSITNETRGKNEKSLYIAPLVEYGDGVHGEYQYKANRDGTEYRYLDPRPFTSRTIEELSRTGIHIDTLVSSLTSKGFKFG